ncbi:hypothetical protein, partial [Erwinia sp. V71]|uniref:hypothetical protein n=1 Tax=Erwinia sp. V71 TaxID=3369424 RepID=UPI003F5E8934
IVSPYGSELLHIAILSQYTVCMRRLQMVNYVQENCVRNMVNCVQKKALPHFMGKGLQVTKR